MRRRLPWPVLLAAIGLAVPLSADQVYRGGTDTVLLTVTTSNAAGQPVGGLDRSNFQVFEDGKLQDISIFSRDPQPIALSLLLDSSTSMEEKLGVAQEAATGFVRRLTKNDVAQVIAFNSQPEIRQTFTNDAVALEHAIRMIRAGGSTALYSALAAAIGELKRTRVETPAEVRRQAIVVLSDGEDTTSINSYDDVADRAKHSDVTVYAIGLHDKASPTRRNFNEADFALRTLSQMTGGRVFFVEDIKQLAGIYNQIADEFANQYTIGYTSKNVKRDGAWRAIAVRVNRPSTSARTKSGYYGPSKER